MRKSLIILCFSLIALIGLTAFWQQPITLWLMGDSTMSVKEPKAYPEMGWGVAFTSFWNNSVKVENHAKNGRSTKTFIEENRWKEIGEKMKAGDYLFIQFGHNDEVPAKKSYTDPQAFEKNIQLFVSTAKSKNVIPVLITPVSRRGYDSVNVFHPNHETYSPIVKKVARETKTILIDLDQLSQALMQQLGPESSKHLFLYLKPGEHPNYPQGKTDDTHFNEYGARLIAQLVLQQIKQQIPGLYSRVVNFEK
ncbi:rhamnogalacturonan acetylesterase [Gynurincola endophyticus]|uniref:rhamnogalacturonan acetylesterase n=1 Tax=Gynurincola endophyticus TaxID=2479004 RepID=UPI000F8E806B|nr:rhamnogalacturonan acetylesterase [Gynurincola endophyticus]